MNIAVTGYVGTGSSAMIDLLREYDGVKIVPEQRRSYEHDVFYRSGGLFDLFAILKQGTSPVCSDKVINRFIETMENLYRYDYVWYGGYKSIVGKDFMKMVDNFVEAISYRFEGSNSTHHLRTRFSPIKALLQFASHVVYKKSYMKYGVGYVRDGRPSYVSIPSEEELVQACRELTNSYFGLFSLENSEFKVFDHLIWPQQTENFMKCFDENNFRVIVMKRDPRDVFLLNKYVWYYSPIGVRTAVPSLRTELNDFVYDWQRTVRKDFKQPNVLQVQFEELVYNYDETVYKIEKFLGLNPQDHVHYQKKSFDPSKSIENTQVFNAKPEWTEEVKPILDLLKDEIYQFPDYRKPNIKLMFD